MLDKLIELGIDETDIKNMQEFINDAYLNDFSQNIKLLESIGGDVKKGRLHNA